MNYNSQNSLESGMKYFCLGALSSGFLLFGISLVFVITKTVDFAELRFLFSVINELPLLLSFALIFIFFGFWFKLSIFPCHAWAPDVYEGALTPVTFFFSVIVKLGVFAFFSRVLFFLLGAKAFLFFWQPFFFFASAGSIVFGAFGALLQTKLKRFVGYTSINQMGYLLMGISSGTTMGLQASFLYLFFYLVMGFAFFSILLYITDWKSGKDVLFINQLRGFSASEGWISLAFACVLLSMAGIPPLIGFFGKFFLTLAAFKAGSHSLVVLAVIMNVVSTFYYLRIIKCMFFETPRAGVPLYFFLGKSILWVSFFEFIIVFLIVSLLFGAIILGGFLFDCGLLSASASRAPAALY
jgi:NADH-quinone oxidoreductase subunit N